ncbi:hypothetical protein [Deinococcus multiflagellatus]|uniref:Phage portal protein n=1 Tax=Deinococcus multiflagellatus TaxID=1656887 RepID=A0ABW1ZGT3_9DEIO|nr:hypothetical protein [Deinococcus multiflagellatus]MBZ9713760.1 hypothetical protein [Deinococcus multiflagellatus]
MLLYGPDGEPITESNSETTQGAGPWWHEGALGDSLQGGPRIYGLDRAATRRRTRRAFFTNPLFGAAVEIAVALLIGDEFTYSPLNADKTAQQALADLWDTNDLGQLMSNRLVTEYLLDGELCAVFPLEDLGDQPARLAHLDIDRGVTLKADVLQGVTQVRAPSGSGGELTWDAGEFVWTAHNALWNDVRGWPVAMRAVAPAEAYLNLLGHRLNTHDLQGRILGVQTVFVDRKDPNSRAIFNEKRAAYRRLPSKGGVLTLAKVLADDGKTVISDEINFNTPASGAANAQHDARAFVRLTALCLLGLPEHYMGEGGTVTRTTADSMTLPAIRSVLRIHAALRSHLDRIYRADLVRRHGPERVYTVRTYDVRDGGLTRVEKKKRVKAGQIEVPWSFPTISQDTLDERIRRAEAAQRHNWASPQTLSASLGFDTAEEVQRLAAAGQPFGRSGTPPPPPPDPEGGDKNAGS